MEDFLIEYKSEITRVVEVTAALTGVILYKKYRHTNYKYFIFFLVYLSVGDFINTYVHYIKDGGFFNFLEGTVFSKNFWWSTLFWFIGAPFFFSFYYSKTLKNNTFKRIVKYSGYAFVVFDLLYISFHFEEYFVRFFPIINVFGVIIIFLCTIFYFIELLQSDIILNFYKNLNFYISTAIFIWWLITTPVEFYDIYNANNDWNFIFLKWQIYLLSNIFMYFTFTFALIWCKPQND